MSPRGGGAASTSLAGLPAPLVAKVEELKAACGSRVISTFRPGATIAGTLHLSEHARHRAADVAGNPACIYAHLHDWRGGMTIDYARIGHVHLSWHPGGFEQGLRFAHFASAHPQRAAVRIARTATLRSPMGF